MMVGAVWSDVRITNERLRSSWGRGGRAYMGTNDEDEDEDVP